MPLTVCPTCGSSVSITEASVPAICPGCCALVHASDGLAFGAHAAAPRRPKPVLRMPLGREPSAPASARHALAVLRPQLGDAPFRVCELLTSELVTNVVRHAPGRSAWSAADMRVRLFSDCVRVEVRDDGLGFKPSARRAEADIGSGWGLHLVEELADEWGVEPGVQNCVWFQLRLAPDESSLPLS